MTKREICERLLKIHNALKDIEPPIGYVFHEVEELLLDLAAPDDHFADPGKMVGKAREEEAPEPEPKSKFPIGHPLHMSTEEMKAADTALFIQTGGRMGKDWRNADEPPVLIYDENGEKVPCPVCGEPAYKIKNKPGVFFCKRCASGAGCARVGG